MENHFQMSYCLICCVTVTEYTAKISYGICCFLKGNPLFQGFGFRIHGRFSLKHLAKALTSYIQKTAQAYRKKAVSDDMVIVFNIHLGELQQLQYNLFRPKKVVVITLFVALDNATKVSVKCNVLCCFSVIKYQLPNHQESTVSQESNAIFV